MCKALLHSMPVRSTDSVLITPAMCALHRATVLLLELTLARSLKSLQLKRYIDTTNYILYTVYYIESLHTDVSCVNLQVHQLKMWRAIQSL
jgi:hypothetical protein